MRQSFMKCAPTTRVKFPSPLQLSGRIIDVSNMCLKYEGRSLDFKMRFATTAIDAIGVIFIVTATILQQYFNTDGFGGAADAMQLAPLLFSLLWSMVSLGIGFAGRRYHPGVDVGMDLLAVLLAGGMVWLLAWWTIEIGSYNGNCYDGDCTPTKASVLKASEIIGIFAVVASALIHLIVCFSACSAVHELRKKRKAERDFHELSEDIEGVKG